MTKQQIIDALLDPRKGNLGNLGVAMVATAKREAAK